MHLNRVSIMARLSDPLNPPRKKNKKTSPCTQTHSSDINSDAFRPLKRGRVVVCSICSHTDGRPVKKTSAGDASRCAYSRSTRTVQTPSTQVKDPDVYSLRPFHQGHSRGDTSSVQVLGVKSGLLYLAFMAHVRNNKRK